MSYEIISDFWEYANNLRYLTTVFEHQKLV